MPPKLLKSLTRRRLNRKASKKDVTGGKGEFGGHGEQFDLNRKVVNPPDQLQLTAEELAEIKTRILKSTNPNAPENIVRYNYEEKKYKFEATVEQTAIHFADDGFLVRKDGEEAKQMKEIQEKRRQIMEEKKQIRAKERDAAAEESLAKNQNDNFEDDDDDDELIEENEEDELKNQFNFTNRATQTLNNGEVSNAVGTEPPPSMDFCATATQWEIYDAYVEMLSQQKMNVRKGGSSKNARTTAEDDVPDLSRSHHEKTINEILESSEMRKSVKLMERMLNQNLNEELLEDFKFWEDESDKFKPGGMGSLLPLWHFQNDQTKNKHVTGLSWNPRYHDLFAVSYGSYNFMKQGGGAIACYSLKNPSYPEYFFKTEVGVTSIDFHPTYSSLLCVGFYDGSVSIYDVRSNSNTPIASSAMSPERHSDVVWQVKWDESPVQSSVLSFNSISSDGRVTNWTFSKGELQSTDLITLKLDMNDEKSSTSSAGNDLNPDESQNLAGLAGGMSFDFNQRNKNMFIVGTEEGQIYLCSKAYNSQYLNTCKGHNMSVYSVCWNNYHENLFLSASADWSVKLWDEKQSEPLMTFDLGASVGEVAWAPYSATVFAAVTEDRHVVVYDLSKNKHDSLCHQAIVKGKKVHLTHIKFNPSEPILLVGDSRGLVQILKLSPNLKNQSSQLEL